MTYSDAGVDIAAGESAVERIKEKVRRTFRPEVLGDIGGFGGLFAFDPSKYRHPVLVSSTDGVGTKLMVARMMGRNDTIGRDLVAMCIDDLVCLGAEPLFFLDYIACSPLDPDLISDVIEGIAEACREANCALVGGEMAEHPGMMNEGEYELAGFAVGVVEKDRMITGHGIAPGDAIIGIESGGLMSNGYSLARTALLEVAGHSLDERLPGLSHRLGEELLRPTPVFASAITSLIEHVEVRGIAHITGGGIPGNLIRILPEKTEAVVDASRWEPDPIFAVIQAAGNVEIDEMYKVFNMGIGMMVVVAEADARETIDHLRSRGHHAHHVGLIRKGKRKVTLEGVSAAQAVGVK
ncbi:MAG: phosphoribosylformylglycinamidine cyclo-ligase [Acidobacteria bacterium]|nr:MAG: phosphoribosylformylglycinamidine cyclo-ligase [Acidobacteriota bacterium]